MRTTFRWVLTLGLAGVAGGLILPANSATELPAWRIDEICARDSARDVCMHYERVARQPIASSWHLVPKSWRDACLSRFEAPLEPSWRILGDCIDDQAVAAAQETRRARLEADRQAELALADSGDSESGGERRVVRLNQQGDTSLLSDEDGVRIVAAMDAARERQRASDVAATGDGEGTADREREKRQRARVLEEAEAAERRRLAAARSPRQLAEEAAERRRARLAAERQLSREVAMAHARRLDRERAARKRRAEQEAERQRLAAASAERERLAREAEAERLAEEKAERERLAREAEAVRLAEEKAERERLAREAEAERLAEEKAERESLAREAEAERLAEEKVERERLAREAEAESLAEEKAERERLAREAEAERLAEEKAERERLDREEKAERERLAAEAERQRRSEAALVARRQEEERERKRLAEVRRKALVAKCRRNLYNLVTTETIRFDTNSATLGRDEKDKIARIVQAAEDCPPARIRVVGHTDARGGRNMNQWLSELRAEAAAKMLASLGIDMSRIEVLGRGESEPIAPNDGPENWARNRRIEFSIE